MTKKVLSFFYYCLQCILFGTARILFRHRVHFIDSNNVPSGAIIASNHASFIDPPLIAISWPAPIHFLANDYLFKNFFFGLLIRMLNAHPVKRNNQVASMKLVCSLLDKNKKVLIFPEGTRSENGQILPFKKGIGVLCQRTQCAIIPTYVHGTCEILPRKTWFPRFGIKTACIFGKPIFPHEFSGVDPKVFPEEVAKRTQREIAKLKEMYEKSQI